MHLTLTCGNRTCPFPVNILRFKAVGAIIILRRVIVGSQIELLICVDLAYILNDAFYTLNE